MTDLDSAFDEAEVTEGGKRLDAGDYEGIVTNARYVTGEDTWKPWVEAALEVQFTTPMGKVTTQWETSPCTKNDGNVNTGWLGILKKNLRGIGYEGSLGDLEAAVMNGQFHGVKSAFTIVDKQQTKINPHTNQPYVDRNVYVNEFIEAGLNQVDVAATVFAADEVPF